MQSYDEQLQTHALYDLTTRAKSGILTYACVWLILAFSYQVNTNHPNFFYLNTGIIFGIFVSRTLHYVFLKKNIGAKMTYMNQWLVITILAAAAHWGGMTAWILFDDTLTELRTIILIITPAFALGGACTLSISSKIRTLYPSLMFLPFIAILLYQGDTQSLSLAALTSISLMYIYSSTRATHDDYWAAVTNHMIAKERAQLMEKLSTTDPLTQLKNRMFFDKEFTKEWQRCSRLQCPLSIIMIDLDYFKQVNDNYGHLFGDECLRKAAMVFNGIANRPTDCVARYGGEEFVVLLPNTDAEATKMLALRVVDTLENLALDHNGDAIKLTCSIGGATTTPVFDQPQESLLKSADTALYEAKGAGRNCYHEGSLSRQKINTNN
jgi:diguanylate cyclase (GGDEF)-like protein